MKYVHLLFLVFSLYCKSKAQQGYSGNDVLSCSVNGKTAPPSPSYLYSCNGQKLSCQTFLLFNSEPNFTLVSTISKLMSLRPALLAQINNASEPGTFPVGKEVIVPLNCSCAGQYYQANASYAVRYNDTYFSIANDVYQGLSSCSSLQGANRYSADDLSVGLDLLVPLRCACPTKKQSMDGIKYLLTYSISENDSIPDLSSRFNVSGRETAAANGFSELDPIVYPLTTILIPLSRVPSTSQTIIHYPIEYNSPPAPELKSSKKSRLPLWIGIGVALLLFVSASISFALWLRKKMKARAAEKKKKPVLPKDVLEYQADGGHALKVFELEELEAATNNFNSELRLGGSVYKGVLRGSLLAIKEMWKDVSREVNILHKLNHFNLISLLGISMSHEHCYLVFEYMQNGSLKDWLYNTSHSGPCSLKQRSQIALDVARGLDYLHNFTKPPYVHKDIKSSNILLDGNLRAKIANFSLARASEREEGGIVITKNVEGTIGYIAPEYLESGMVTPKLDVFAFGVVMLELMTGKDAVIQHEGKEKLLSALIISMIKGSNAQVMLGSFMSPALRDDRLMDVVMAVAKLSVACLNPDPENRPSIEEVVSVLSIIQRDLLHRDVL